MATTADFVGRNCPHCGAIDSLETDDALGEVACTECALVVAMGLEENALTRYDKDATYEDVDRHREREDTMATTLHAISASSASTAAAGLPGGEMLSKVTLHPNMLNCIRSLQKKSGVPEEAIGRAVNIAKRYVAGRRARRQRIEKQQEIAAVCFMIAAEQMNHPVPLAEMRQLEPNIGGVEYRRAQVVTELHMEDEEQRLKGVYADNLLTVYLRKLSLQLSHHTPRCQRILEALQQTEALRGVGIVDKIIMAVLLNLTSTSFDFGGKTHVPGSEAHSSSSNPSTETIYANFAAKAHLDVDKVKKMIKTATQNMPAILVAFAATTAPSASDAHSHAVKREAEDDKDENDTMNPANKRVKLEHP